MNKLMIILVLLTAGTAQAQVQQSGDFLCDAPFEGIIFSVVEKDPNLNNVRTIHVEYGSAAPVEILPVTKVIQNGTKITYLANADTDRGGGGIWLKPGSIIAITIDLAGSVRNKSGEELIGTAKFHLEDEKFSKREKILCSK